MNLYLIYIIRSKGIIINEISDIKLIWRDIIKASKMVQKRLGLDRVGHVLGFCQYRIGTTRIFMNYRAHGNKLDMHAFFEAELIYESFWFH